MDYKAVIFDMDGVLVDSEPIYRQLNDKLFDTLKVKITDEEYESFVGMASRKMWSYIIAKGNLPLSVEECIKMEKEGIYAEMQNRTLRPIEGVQDILHFLGHNKTSKAIASSNSSKAISLITGKMEISHHFDVCIGGEMIRNGKPAPDIFLLAAEKLQTEPRQCIVIEDSHNGLRGAREAGMYAIGFKNTNSGNQDLSPAHRITDRLHIDIFKGLIG